MVGRVEVDGKEISLAKPDKFLCHLFSTIEGKDIQSDAMPSLKYTVKHLKRGYGVLLLQNQGKLIESMKCRLIGLLERYEFSMTWVT